MSFKEITIKEIGNVTSFTRTSIYNYFQTKGEIFLALLKRENERWIALLKQAMEEANDNYVFMTIYEITCNYVRKLLNCKKAKYEIHGIREIGFNGIPYLHGLYGLRQRCLY